MSDYHIRHPNGVTVDLTGSRTAALEEARTIGAQVFELTNGIATLIYQPPAIRPVKQGD